MNDREREIQNILNSIPTQSLNAVNRLRQLGRIGIPALAVALQYPNPVIRAGAAKTLGRMNDAAAVPALSEGIADSDATVRAAAILALSDIPGPEAIAALAGALHARHGLVRDCAARALARRSLAALRQALCDADPVARAAAIHGVGYYARDSESVPRLREMLRDDDAGVRVMAVRGLAWVATRHGEALASLLEALRHPDEEVRATAAHSLGRVGNATITEALAALLHDPSRRVLLATLRALGCPNTEVPGGRTGVGDCRAVPALLEHLEGPDGEVRIAAADALAYILSTDAEGQRDERTVPLLTRCLAEPDPRLRAASAAALGFARDPEVISSLGALLHEDAAWVVRASAAAALGALGDDAAIPVLESARADIDLAVSRQADLALHRIRSRDARPVLRR